VLPLMSDPEQIEAVFSETSGSGHFDVLNSLPGLRPAREVAVGDYRRRSSPEGFARALEVSA